MSEERPDKWRGLLRRVHGIHRQQTNTTDTNLVTFPSFLMLESNTKRQHISDQKSLSVILAFTDTSSQIIRRQLV